jgi:hypothetical protein
MTWTEALDILVARTRHERYRQLCAEDHPDHEVWRARVVSEATGQPIEYPSVATQVGNALGAAARFVASGGAVVSEEEQARRLAICGQCEHFDAEAGRCKVCGCIARWKARLATEHCPLPEPKW